MKLCVYCFYDKLLKVWTRPLFANTPKKDAAEEWRRQIVPNPQKYFQMKDLELYFAGTYNDADGRFELLDKPEFLVRLEEYFPAKEVSENVKSN